MRAGAPTYGVARCRMYPSAETLKVRTDAHDLEARIFKELPNRRAREIVEVHVEEKDPRASHQRAQSSCRCRDS